MPCFYTGSALGDANLEASEARQKLTEVNSLLCKIMDYTESQGEVQYGELLDEIKGLKKYWNEHKEVDEKRKNREAEEKRQRGLKEKALSKLSKQEKEALGLRVN